MKTFNKEMKLAIQGDIAIMRVDALPDDLKERSGESNGVHILAHSETGHHHTVPSSGTQFFNGSDDFVSYLVVEEDGTELTHNRSYDTHETISFDAGVYRVNRQREYMPEGYRRVAD